jgi:hypothetical protein
MKTCWLTLYSVSLVISIRLMVYICLKNCRSSSFVVLTVLEGMSQSALKIRNRNEATKYASRVGTTRRTVNGESLSHIYAYLAAGRKSSDRNLRHRLSYRP